MLPSQKALTWFSSALISAVGISCLNSKPTRSPWELFTSRDFFSQRNYPRVTAKCHYFQSYSLKTNKAKLTVIFFLLLWVWWAWSPDTKPFLPSFFFLFLLHGTSLNSLPWKMDKSHAFPKRIFEQPQKFQTKEYVLDSSASSESWIRCMQWADTSYNQSTWKIMSYGWQGGELRQSFTYSFWLGTIW